MPSDVEEAEPRHDENLGGDVEEPEPSRLHPKEDLSMSICIRVSRIRSRRIQIRRAHAGEGHRFRGEVAAPRSPETGRAGHRGRGTTPGWCAGRHLTAQATYMACQPGPAELGSGSQIRRREWWIRAWEAGPASSATAGSRRRGEECQVVPVVEAVDLDSGRRDPPCWPPEIAGDREDES